MPRQWTDEQRAEASKKAILHQPWKKSTGPRSLTGKKKSARNSYKHGFFSREKQIIRWYIRLAALRLRQLNAHRNMRLEKLRNELIAQRSPKGNFQPDIDAFYPYMTKNPIKFFSKR
jgi:hypothetical protein